MSPESIIGNHERSDLDLGKFRDRVPLDRVLDLMHKNGNSNPVRAMFKLWKVRVSDTRESIDRATDDVIKSRPLATVPANFTCVKSGISTRRTW